MNILQEAEAMLEKIDKELQHNLPQLAYENLLKDSSKLVADLVGEVTLKDKALIELACLGNGSFGGNSEGNVIAQRALGLTPSRVYGLSIETAFRDIEMEGDISNE